MSVPGLLEQASRPTLRRAAKSAEAFRTISEVADELEVPQHVLRFWESKFPQVRPLKRAGGRRYYRPDDVVLLKRIRQCLYEQGYTIKGVLKLMREGGLKSDAAAAALPRPAAETHRSPPAAACLDDGLRDMLRHLRADLVAMRDAIRRS